MKKNNTVFPLLLAGPILRRVGPREFTLWLVTSRDIPIKLEIFSATQALYSQELATPELQTLPLGKKCFVQFIYLQALPKLPKATPLFYSLAFFLKNTWLNLAQLHPELTYNQNAFQFQVPEQLHEIFHGSCRKPHFPGVDALALADQEIKSRINNQEKLPDLLLLTGDQVYVDDLCGPMLVAVHQIIELLEIPHEAFPSEIELDEALVYQTAANLYQRRRILPEVLAKNRWSRYFLGGNQPIFTSKFADNHLISFGEIFCLYLLCWSPVLWEWLDWEQAPIHHLSPKLKKLFEREKQALLEFQAGLAGCQRLMANLPTLMIFDDHDVTDDWNLSKAWENAAYGHAFSRRIIGNALLAYWFCQGWGNSPQSFPATFWQAVMHYAHQPDNPAHEALLQTLFSFKFWSYDLPTQPPLVVLDTRTRRWPAKTHPALPSGLMDLESLNALEARLLGQAAVVIVSPAPIFGMKSIEVLQKVMIFLGKALAVDAENWMVHPEAAAQLLEIFTHPQTPQKFSILSGDVHYSYVYDIVLRFQKSSPQIWQITSSGLKNAFPPQLLTSLGGLNRYLFHRWSPLNYFTQRKEMKIKPRILRGSFQKQWLNQSTMGSVRFDNEGTPVEMRYLIGPGKVVDFVLD